MKKLILILTAATLALSVPVMADAAAACRDAKGKFIKCPPAAPAKAGKCRDAKGKFIKCKA